MGAVPLHAPIQPTKTELASGVAVSVTFWAGVVFATETLQVASYPVTQLTPPPLIVPPPLPTRLAVRVKLAGWKLAYAERSPLIDTVHVGVVPLHAPDQPTKMELASGVAVIVTVWAGVVFAIETLQVGSHPVVQLAPPPAIVPPPLPIGLTVSVYFAGANWANTERSPLIDTVQVVALPLQTPSQPTKTDVAFGVAVSVTV